MSSNGLKTELIQRLELALDEEEFGSEAQEMEELEVASPKKTKKVESKRKETLAVLAAAFAVTMADEESEKLWNARAKEGSPVKKAATAIVGSSFAALAEAKEENDGEGATATAVVSEEKKEEWNKDSESSGKVETDAPGPVMTEEEKRAARAAKFGIPLSIEDKKVGAWCSNMVLVDVCQLMVMSVMMWLPSSGSACEAVPTPVQVRPSW
jgi:hypothetical protein